MSKTTFPVLAFSAVNKKNPAGGQIPAKDGSLFLQELRDVYGAEKHQEFILPLLKRAASSLKLQSVLASHIYDTYQHITRLVEVFGLLGERAQERKTAAILGLARECEQVMGETRQGTATRDAGLILAARQLEHYEISAYGSLAQLARTLEYDEIADILESTLIEEKDADDLLESLAENYIHPDASRE
jgi:ferritin-like metal-binding protein YciE